MIHRFLAKSEVEFFEVYEPLATFQLLGQGLGVETGRGISFFGCGLTGDDVKNREAPMNLSSMCREPGTCPA